MNLKPNVIEDGNNASTGHFALSGEQDEGNDAGAFEEEDEQQPNLFFPDDIRFSALFYSYSVNFANLMDDDFDNPENPLE